MLRPYKCVNGADEKLGCGGRGGGGGLGPGFEEVGGVDGAEAGGEVVAGSGGGGGGGGAGGVGGAEAGGEVVAGSGGVGGVVVVGGGGEFADDFFVGAVAIVEVAGFLVDAAGDVDVAESDVVEDAGGGGEIAGSLAGVATRK